ncbi:hypothetical protein LPJ55_004515 [Coemansia sp. RSA 990]|nr:hypothetical protein LPJ55_004515 [Coemansia sp. RSA 990]
MSSSGYRPPAPPPAKYTQQGYLDDKYTQQQPYGQGQLQRTSSTSVDLIESDNSCLRSCIIGFCDCCCCCCRGEMKSNSTSRGGGQYAGCGGIMWRVPMAARLRLRVVAGLCIWMVLLAVLGFTRLLQLPLSDKAQHFVGFGVMSVLVLFSFQAAVPRRRVWTLTAAGMGGACVFSEVLQRLLTTRPFEWGDIAANVLGAATFLFAGWMADRWIVQPRAGSAGRAQYWSLGNAEPGSRLSADFEMTSELDLELDDILVDSP